jgi:cytochrome c oxidase subunit 3
MATISGSGIKQPYYVPEPSPWPIIGSVSAFIMFAGVLAYMHPDMWGNGLEPVFTKLGPWSIAPGMLLVLFTMTGWWITVADESSNRHLLTPPTRLALRYGMFLFIASEVMFFVAFFWAFFNFALFPEHANSDVWPPKDIHVFNPWDLPFLNTLILLTSGTTVTWAHHALRENNRPHLIYGLALTIVLGIAFT